MLIAHAMTYALPSLKYSFNNLVAYYKKNRKEMKSELPRIRRVSMDKSKLLDKLVEIAFGVAEMTKSTLHDL